MVYYFMYLPLFVGVLCWSSIWYALLYDLSSFATVNWSFSEIFLLFFPFFSPEKNSKTSKVNQQSVLNL